MQIHPLRSYRATLVPAGTAYDELEARADQGVLPTLQLKAINHFTAERDAHRISGQPVFRVDRIDGGAV